MDAKFILGINNPLLVAVISNPAEASKVKVPMPMPWENEYADISDKAYKVSNLFLHKHALRVMK